MVRLPCRRLRRLTPGRSAEEKCFALAWIEILLALLLLAPRSSVAKSTRAQKSAQLGSSLCVGVYHV